jgi:TetR/AcrR family transcriptional regulator of autoinduction and epiphytic fitness
VTSPSLPKTRLTDKKRADIVRAAAAEFQARGFDGTSMDQIAARAEVSKRTVYNHFPSKDELFQEIIAELTARSSSTESFSFDETDTLDEQLTTIGAAILEAMAGDDFINLARVVLSRFLHSPELAARIHKGHKPFRVGLINWLDAASDRGCLKVADADKAAMQFVALLNSSALWPQVLAGQPPLTPEERAAVVRSTVSMFLDHYSK